MASFKQLKVSVEPDLAASFRAACMNAGVSMAAELSDFMAARAGTALGAASKATNNDGYDTRAKRRHLVNQIVNQLEIIMEHEDAYRLKIPENLQAGQAYENAELSIDTLEQAIDLLKEAY